MNPVKIFALVLGLWCPTFSFAQEVNPELYYSDYRQLQRALRNETKRVDQLINEANVTYIRQVARYGRCRSNKWRIAFETSLTELAIRMNELNVFKQTALLRKNKLNSEWLHLSKEYSISSVRSDQKITDYVIWYENFSSNMRQGPLQELELYVLSVNKLSEAYERMSEACDGNSSAVSDSETWILGVRGLIEEVTGILGAIG